MKRNIFNTILVSFFILIFVFSFKNTEAFDFKCSTATNPSGVVITVETKDYEPDLWKIGILDVSIKDYTGSANFNNALDVKGDTFSATYYFDQLDKGVTYRTLIFSKEANKFAQDLLSCKFTVPPLTDGACGTAKGQTFESKPIINLCASGDLTEVKQNYNNWEWACNGSNGGKNAPCTAKVGKTTVTTATSSDNSTVDASSKGGGLMPDCPATGCGFDELMTLINNVIKFLLFTIATPLAALIFVYAGIMLLTSGGSSEKMTTAKKILKNVIIGYVIALAAWLIINTILTSLGYNGPTFLVD